MYVLFFLKIFHFKTGEVLSFNEILWLQEKRLTLKPKDLGRVHKINAYTKQMKQCKKQN